MIRITKKYPRLSMRKTEQAIGWAVCRVLGDKANLANITFNFDEDEMTVTNHHGETETMSGLCVWYNWEKTPTFDIEIHPNMTERQFMMTLFHELVHVRQYMHGELIKLPVGEELYRWRGTNIRARVLQYHDLPWEIEASTEEKKFYQEWKAY
jgi:hypothetical protein